MHARSPDHNKQQCQTKLTMYLPASTVRDDFPSFSDKSCFVHLYVEMDQDFIVSILLELDRTKAPPFSELGEVGVGVANGTGAMAGNGEI